MRRISRFALLASLHLAATIGLLMFVFGAGMSRFAPRGLWLHIHPHLRGRGSDGLRVSNLPVPGLEWQAYDRTAADGPRRTICFGYVRSRACHQFRTGPVVPCTGR